MSNAGQPQEGMSMWLRRANEKRLITAQIAIAIARLVLKEEYGQSEVDQNEPFSVTEDGDIWIVQGRDTPLQNTTDQPGLALAGPFQMRISKFNGQIFECCFVMRLPMAGGKAE